MENIVAMAAAAGANLGHATVDSVCQSVSADVTLVRISAASTQDTHLGERHN